MLPSPGYPQFGDTRQINRQRYTLYEYFDSIDKERNKARAKESKRECKEELNPKSIRVISNQWGSYAVYYLEEN